ncbi:MAG: phosphoribosylglycinamide formyltransferase [Saprospiraceae bacterium]|nr:phosphoribosylglycinamide formyltransferase [Saprospiraceae bacterium]
MKRIAIFASGTGSNAQKIIEFTKNLQDQEVALVVTNKSDAGVLEIAEKNEIESLVINRRSLNETNKLLEFLIQKGIDFIVLAGFLLLVPRYLVKAFPKRIVNIHPALLPKFGGKGMFGNKVHQAVKAAGELTSGPTIHYVNEHYDDGAVIFQAECSIDQQDSSEDIAAKVLQLEHKYYPKVVASLVTNLP